MSTNIWNKKLWNKLKKLCQFSPDSKHVVTYFVKIVNY